MIYVPTYTFCGRSVKWGNILACSSQGRFTLGSEEMNNIARVNIFIVWETSKNCDCRSKCVDFFVCIMWKTYPFVFIELNLENASSLGRRDGVIWIFTQAISSWWRNRTLKSFHYEFEQLFEKIESSLRDFTILHVIVFSSLDFRANWTVRLLFAF